MTYFETQQHLQRNYNHFVKFYWVGDRKSAITSVDEGAIASAKAVCRTPQTGWGKGSDQQEYSIHPIGSPNAVKPTVSSSIYTFG